MSGSTIPGIAKLVAEMTGTRTTPLPTPDPYESAVETAKRQYPWLNRIGPIKLMQGTGPYMSESYMPKADENPHPGNFTVELRNPKLVNNPDQWPATIGREGMDWMARADPVYQDTADQFIQLMKKNPRQLEMARKRYNADEGIKNSYTFDEYLKQAEAQEFIGGYVFNMGDWRKHGGYTAEQQKLLDKLSAYMWQGQPAQSLDIP